MIQIEKLTAILFAVIALTFSYSVFAEDDENPCTEENPCEEVVVSVPRPAPTDWSSCIARYTRAYCEGEGFIEPGAGSPPPTPAPVNSASDNCEGSGCINYEDSYQQMCHDSFLTGYDEQNWFQEMFSASAYRECITAQTVTNAMCSLLDMHEVIDDAGTIGGCAAACAKAAANYKKIKNKSLGPGGMAVCTTLCVASINAGDDAICQ